MADFRTIALSFPGATESSHMNHPDFRVAGRIFASLGYPTKSWGMLKLTLEQQAMFVAIAPDTFKPVKGGWGRRGATNVLLQNAGARILKKALREAWANVAAKRGSTIK